MKRMKNKLDEMQEQKLLHIEHNGCWFAFWALIVAMFVQMAVFGIENVREIAGEWIVFMMLALYLAFSCMKNGIWDRKLEPNLKTNAVISLVSAIGFGLVFAIVNYCNFKSAEAAFFTFLIMAIILFIAIYHALMVSTLIYKKRVHDMDQAFDEEK